MRRPRWGRLVPLALLALGSCATRLDVGPVEPDAGARGPVVTGLALGPAVPLYTGGAALLPAVGAGSDGRDWLIVSTIGDVHVRDASGAWGAVWRLPDVEGEELHLLPGTHRVSIAGTSTGFVFAWTTGEGAVRLVRALADGTMLESAIVTDPLRDGPSRALVAPSGDGAWLTVESCPPGAPTCVVRVDRLSLDARGARVMEAICDRCAEVAAGSTVLAGDANGAVLGWRDAEALRFRALHRLGAGPVLTAHEPGGEEPPGRLTVAAHGETISVAWATASGVLRHRVASSDGSLLTPEPERVGTAGSFPPVLVPLGDDAVLVADTEAAWLLGPPAEPFAWERACIPVVSAAGPSERTLVLCQAFDFPALFEVSRARSVDVTLDYVRASTLPTVALGCDAYGCSVASEHASRTSVAPWSFDPPARGEPLELASSALGGLTRTGGIAYVALGDTLEWSTRSVVRADATAIRAALERRALAIAPSAEEGAVLIAEAPDPERLSTVRWRGELTTPLSEVPIVPPSDLERCRLRTPDCWLESSVVLRSGGAGWALLWVDGDRDRVTVAAARSEDVALSIPVTLAAGERVKSHPTIAVVGSLAVAAWDEATSPEGFEVCVATVELATGAVRSLRSPLAEAGRAPQLVTVGEVALLAWREAGGDVRVARLDGGGAAVDPTDRDALALEGCTAFGLVAVDHRRAAVWCREERAVSVRTILVPESLR